MPTYIEASITDINENNSVVNYEAEKWDAQKTILLNQGYTINSETTITVTFPVDNGSSSSVGGTTLTTTQLNTLNNTPQAHDSAKTYIEGDQVVSGGKTYVALRNIPAGTAVTSTAHWEEVGGGAVNSIGTSTVGTSKIRTRGNGLSVAIADGHITVTIAAGGELTDISAEMVAADMTYTEAPFFNDNGLRLTIDNSANSSSSQTSRTPTVFKRSLTGAISASNPATMQDALSVNSRLVRFDGGIVSYAWNDLAAQMPNGCIITL